MSFNLNGTSSYVVSTSTPVTGVPFTMACWVKSSTPNQAKTIMYMGNSGTTSRFQLDIASNLFRLTAGAGGPTVSANGTIPVNNEVWYHIAGVCTSPTNRYITINGSNKSLTNTTSRIPLGINNITLGAQILSSTVGSFFQGTIAEAAIWNVALTDDQVLSLGQGFAPYLIEPNNLKFYNRCIRESQDLYGGVNLTSFNLSIQDHPRIYG